MPPMIRSLKVGCSTPIDCYTIRTLSHICPHLALALLCHSVALLLAPLQGLCVAYTELQLISTLPGAAIGREGVGSPELHVSPSADGAVGTNECYVPVRKLNCCWLPALGLSLVMMFSSAVALLGIPNDVRHDVISEVRRSSGGATDRYSRWI
jgi:hypothetical protein